MGATLAALAILKYSKTDAANPTIKVGFVSSQTGSLAGFGEADEIVLKVIRAAFAGGVENNGNIALIGMLVAVLVAMLIFRLRGAYFAIGTWVIAEVFRLSAAQITSLGGGAGPSLPIGIVKSIASSKTQRDSTIYWSAFIAIMLSSSFRLHHESLATETRAVHMCESFSLPYYLMNKAHKKRLTIKASPRG